MSATWVFLAYGGAVLLALLLLYLYEPTRWVWHILALAIAVGLAVIRLPPEFSTPAGTLALGSLILFLLFWGLGFPVFRNFHHRRTQ